MRCYDGEICRFIIAARRRASRAAVWMASQRMLMSAAEPCHAPPVFATLSLFRLLMPTPVAPSESDAPPPAPPPY